MAFTRTAFVLVGILSCFCQFSNGLLEPIPLPKILKDCYDLKSYHLNMTMTPGRKIQEFCQKDYEYSVAGHRWAPKITEGGMNYINSLVRQILKEAYDLPKEPKKHRRSKRGAKHKHSGAVPVVPIAVGTIPVGPIAGGGVSGGPILGSSLPAGSLSGGAVSGGPVGGGIPAGVLRGGFLPRPRNFRFRQEVRTMTQPQWRYYAAQLNRLKRTIVDQEGNSAYDLISFLHSGAVIEQAHGGPNFPGWHRWYLLILETALGTGVPYWDSSLDHEMMEPQTSILWTEKYLGNGDGFVTTGPFAQWRTILDTPLLRNIGTATASLVTKEAIGLVLSRRQFVEITEPKMGEEEVFSLEGHHNGPHNWVGGYMAFANAAAWEPTFFLHHSFIDYIWALFRRGQILRGINPEIDYPLNTPVGHEWYNTTDFRPFYGTVRNIDSLSERLARLVTYAPAPTCPFCGSIDLQCNKKKWVCVSVPGASSSASVMAAGAAGATQSRTAAYSLGPLPLGRKFRPSPFRDARARNPEIPYTDAAPAVAFSGDNLRMRSAMGRKKRSIQNNNENSQTQTMVHKPFVNSYLLDGVIDLDRWAFVSVEVVFRKLFLESSRHAQSKLAVYPHCLMKKPDVSKIFVTTDGLDYSGTFTNYVIPEDKSSFTSRLYVGIKNPKSGSGKVLFTAYDVCGRTCRPLCLVPNSSPRVYKKCTGAFRVTSLEPKMYAIAKENVEPISQKPENLLTLNVNDKTPPLKFICDNQETWPWN